MTPRDHTSERAVPRLPPSNCSGAMNIGVPPPTPAEPERAAADTPKSVTTTEVPSARRIRFEGFRSWCTMPASCVACSASAIWIATGTRRSRGRTPSRSTDCARSVPSTNSMRSTGAPSTSSVPKTWTMFGWSTSLVCRASRKSSPAAGPRRVRYLWASCRPRCSTSHTSPCPPAPSSRRRTLLGPGSPAGSSPSPVVVAHTLVVRKAGVSAGLPAPGSAALGSFASCGSTGILAGPGQGPSQVATSRMT